jgi:hypothetical protein
LQELEKPLYGDKELVEDKYYIAKKLGITTEQLDDYVSTPGNNYSDYSNWDLRYNLMKRMQSVLTKMLGINIKSYS